ncbi:DUF2252 domain-containing protein [Paraburkholderia saeva]|uniref:DUF2252 domain-containing protein n=1 Tax=Paraburkholderia saeva TaxID=2777537 RepID=A0A9N8RW28_9BURK|nr:DUF2252 domain-containing protein [Paraburkholderia saeva]CAG4887199.1 hypothetical protein R52603_00357 [Paraburkholderia saeva]CAG4894742.1 hypothetical protein LMG31841_01977 [Paraburkholderia saeva]CAG4898477.1 hypothetical protein R70241_02480 [Paraburkholderia saeva]
MTSSNIAEREAAGRAARERSKRSSHRTVGDLDRDPVALLRKSSEGRVPRLVPLRYGRMSVSPFTFFRGTAIIQAHDLSKVQDTGIVMPICGDGHLMNFGGFATPERQLAFDLNDFDEVAYGPWEWDLKRLTASFVVAARHMRLSRSTAEALVMSVVTTYRDWMQTYAGYGTLELWYDRITFERMIETAVTPEARRALKRGLEKAASRTHESMLEKMAERVDDRWHIRDVPPGLFHVHGNNTLFGPEDDWITLGDWRPLVGKMYEEYLGTLTHDRRNLLRHFETQDMVFKVVGVGSVGTRCLVMLNTDHLGKPLFLQIKEANKSVVGQYYKLPHEYKALGIKHHGERVVRGQRVLQAVSDIFLGWATGPSGRHFYVRQLRDMKLSANIELFDNTLLDGYARICGWIMARAHAKASGRAIEIGAYIGRGDQFAEALVGYASAYADQVEKDYDVFITACRNGDLEARTEEDMAADFRV